MAELMERRAKVVDTRSEIADLLDDEHRDFGGIVPSAIVQDFIVIEMLAKKIRSKGCIIKDLNAGLLDFLSERDGREVYLCWRYGEPRIEFYHELHTGFQSRQHI
jgi:hypothetical protein